jgi:dephospho-CoA kinase
VVRAVVDRFGSDVLGAEGAVDRSALGARAFADPEGMRFLEGLIHPRVGSGRARWVAEQRALEPPPPLLVCEVPLLFEVGAEGAFDAVLAITAGEDVRRARVEERGQRFDERRARQLPEEEKVARADAAYVNDGSLADLESWVADRFAELAGRPCGG